MRRGRRSRRGARRLASATLLLALLLAVLRPPAVVAQEPLLPQPPVERLAGASRVETAVAISRAVFPAAGAEVAVLARADEFADALVGGPLARALGGPILLTAAEELSPPTAEELARLGVTRVVLLGGPAALGPQVETTLAATVDVRRIAGDGRVETAALVAAELPPGGGAVVATGADFPDALALAPYAAATGRPILLTGRDALAEGTRAALAARGVGDVVLAGGTAAVSAEVEAALAAGGRTVSRIFGRDRYETAARAAELGATIGLDPRRPWLATAGQFPDALAAGPAVAATGGSLLLVDGMDLRGPAVIARRLRAVATTVERITVLGGDQVVSGSATDQLAAVLYGPELAAGGWRLVPDLRLAGLYGHSADPRLGVLGDTPPEQAAPRAAAVAAAYAEPGRPAVPLFELIATTAQRGPGPDGTFSQAIDTATARRYLDAVRSVGGVLVLDLQPGRSDFLDQARRYEALLREPDVGLGLDPEWRVGPGGVPGRDEGTVDAEEVNRVAAYLSALVVEERLPQKVLVVHRFTDPMVTGVERLVEPDGVALVLDMDGIGTREEKARSYARYGDARFGRGLMIFLDRDPDPFSPEAALALVPAPDLVVLQ